MKKVFIVTMEYEENTESLFTEVGIGCTLDDELYDLKASGFVKSYENTVVAEIPEEELCSRCGVVPLPEDSPFYHCETCRRK